MKAATYPIVLALLATAALPIGAARPDVESANVTAAPSPKVDFVNDVQPILAHHCYQCHGPETQEAGLRLDLRKAAFAGSDNGPVIVAGRSSESPLVRLIAGLDEDVGRMPPEDGGEPLSAKQIAVVRAWIDAGAEWPEAANASGETGSSHWALQPIARPALPEVNHRSWVRNPIDAFILAMLEAENVQPSPEADPTTLLRRVYLDLIGLPPSPQQMEAFLADKQPGAYERVVDALLESPHYGERWGRHWLDVARYADTDGYEKDGGRPFAWRYRDWVIGAVNDDLPYDVFTVQQLAGDLLSTGDREFDDDARIATGFQRNTLINREGGIDPEEDRVKRTIDRTNTVGTAWLGLTVGCANCHNHKYDPVSQEEYFGLYAFFNSLDEVDLPAKASAASAKPHDGAAFASFQAVAETSPQRDTHIHLRGDFLSPGPKVAPHTPAVLPPLVSRGAQADRLDLARWIVGADNPLAARVVVNRLWQLHFGRGLTPTVDDFGTQGERPSHPELLDWLAHALRDSGWRLKQFHRLVVNSATYRQSSAARPELIDRDPYNAWLSRQNRLRVEAEIVRDVALAVGGLLDATVGGPSVRPPQPPGVNDVTFESGLTWQESTGGDRFRRGMYTWFQRTSPYPALVTFDAPDANLSCMRRERSDTPLQALTILNDLAFVECAHVLGRRMMSLALSENVGDEAATARIRLACRIGLSRDPSDREIEVLRALYDDARSNPESADNDASGDLAGCFAVARAIMNLDEFITRE